MRKCIVLALFVSLFLGCKKDVPVINPELKKAREFLSALVTTIQQHWVRRNSVDWVEFRKHVLSVVDEYNGYMGNMQKGIQLSLSLLGDKHTSFVYKNGQEVRSATNQGCGYEQPAMVSLDATIGYVNVVGFTSANSPAAEEAYIAAIYKQLKESDNPTLKGWIVDLRTNTGGRYTPMLKAVAPFFQAGTAMYFVYPDSTFSEMAISAETLRSAYHLKNPQVKVAVLTSQNTASAGEAVAITFRSRANTRSFGNSTCGVSTGRAGYEIGDVGQLVISTSIMADKDKHLYGSSVQPDEVEPSSGEAFKKAIQWLKR
jgi:hypothetical protein